MNTRGTALLLVLVYGSLAMAMIIGSISGYALFEHKAAARTAARDKAFHVAEAGIQYYRWHMAEYPGDFTSNLGTHPYYAKDGTLIGAFALEVDPPVAGSNTFVVRSVGTVLSHPSISRTIQVTYTYQNVAKYALLSNANFEVSFDTDVHGAIHSNGGIRFDGTADNWVTSAKETYQYETQTHSGVWGGGGPKSWWKYPVPAVDFSSFAVDLANLQELADANGMLLSASGASGWQLVFTSSTVSTYKVLTKDCYEGEGSWKKDKKDWYWDGTILCEDIGTKELVSTGPYPTNGVIFVEDDVWVEGVVNGLVTIGVGTFPTAEEEKTISISNDLVYAAKDGSDVLGLFAEGDIIVPYEIPSDLEIDGALLSATGMIHRPFYYDDEKDELTTFGSHIANSGVEFTHHNGWGNVISGFNDIIHNYDATLATSPPLGFPSLPSYTLVKWEEL